MVGIYEEEEQAIQQDFEKNYSQEVTAVNDMLKIYEACLSATSGKIKDTDYPEWTLSLLLSQPLLLLNNSIDLLSRGYLRNAESLLRINGETIVLAAYLKAFPQFENEFYELNNKVFFERHPLKNMLKRVEKVGKYFFRAKNPNERSEAKSTYRIICGESNKFVHTNMGVIFELLRNHQATVPEHDSFILGPQKFSDGLVQKILVRIMYSLMFSIATIKICLKIQLEEEEQKKFEAAGVVYDKLSQHDTYAPNTPNRFKR
jgi:hypothetical protein